MPTFTSYDQGTPCWIELTTTDLPGGSAFYADLFGWDLETRSLDDGAMVYTVGRLEGAEIAGLTDDMPADLAGHPAFWSVYLAVDDVDAATARVAPAGGVVDMGPFDIGPQGRMSAIQDPTGARVNLWQAADHVGTGRANEPGTPIWNEVITPDVDRALAFYAEVVGIGAERMEIEGRPYTCLTSTAGTVVGAAANPEPGGPDVPPHWNVHFNVVDCDASTARAVELGAAVVVPAFDVPGIGRMALLSDPQGAAFWVMQVPQDA